MSIDPKDAALSALNELISACDASCALPGMPDIHSALPTAQRSARTAATYLRAIGLAEDARRLIETSDELFRQATDWLLAMGARNLTKDEYDSMVVACGEFPWIPPDSPDADLLLQSEWNGAGRAARELKGHAMRLVDTISRSDQTLAKVKPKRSTNRGDARAKIISALTLHHQYENGSCLNFEPIQGNALARQIKVAPSSVSDFFKAEFDGHAKYMVQCHERTKLITALRMLNDPPKPKLLNRNLGNADSKIEERD